MNLSSQRKEPKSFKRTFEVIIDCIIIVVLLFMAAALLGNITGYAKVNNVIGNSMEPNFQEGNYTISSTHITDYKRGDVVIVDTDKYEVIKRIIGLPNEKIEIKENSIYINGELLPEDYLKYKNNKENKTITLKENEYYILGDNRDVSRDSRSYGPIITEKIISVVYCKIDTSNSDIEITKIR